MIHHNKIPVNLSGNVSLDLYEEKKTIMSIVCFIASIMAFLWHLALINVLSQVRHIYRPCLIIGLHFMFFSYILNLITCSMSTGAEIIASLLHFTYLSSGVWILLSIVHNWLIANTQTVLESHRQIRSRHFHTRAHNAVFAVVSLIIGLGVPTALVSVGYIQNAYKKKEISPLWANKWESDIAMETYSIVVCGLCSVQANILYLFFLPMFVTAVLQLLFLALIYKMRSSRSDDIHLIVQRNSVAVNFWMTFKLSISNLFIWLAALCATLFRLVAIWHIFTLFCALQAIYIAVNFTLTRSVFDVVHQFYDRDGVRVKRQRSTSFLRNGIFKISNEKRENIEESDL